VRGALLAFASKAELDTVLEKSKGTLSVKKVHVALTPLEIAIPAREEEDGERLGSRFGVHLTM